MCSNWFEFLIESRKKLEVIVLDDREEIDYIIDYYKNLYLADGISQQSRRCFNWGGGSRLVGVKLGVKLIMYELGSSRTPGLDGFPWLSFTTCRKK